MLKQEESIAGNLHAMKEGFMKGEMPMYIKSIFIVIETLI